MVLIKNGPYVAKLSNSIDDKQFSVSVPQIKFLYSVSQNSAQVILALRYYRITAFMHIVFAIGNNLYK
jgi:hypothetical protein